MKKNVAAQLRSVAEEGDFILKPRDFLPYEDNTKEYQRRFKSQNSELFAAETKFLDMLLTLADRENIKVVIANMPLMPVNMSLMPAGAYKRYMDVVAREVTTHHCAFVDLNDQKQFVGSDFRDTAHMNSNGGKKFVDAIVNAIAQDPAAKIALTQSDLGPRTISSAPDRGRLRPLY